jgi:hypothetical protein
MQRLGRIAAVSCALLLCACGGDKKDAGGTGEAKVELSAMDELKGLSTELQAGVDGLMAPINEVDGLINDVTSAPGRLGIDAGSLMSMDSATMSNGQVAIAADFSADAAVRAEVEAILGRLNNIVVELKATPDKVAALSAKVVEATARVPVLATGITTSAQMKLTNPLGSAEGKAQAQADLSAVAGVQADVQATIADVQNKIAGIPAMGAQALAKLTAAFAGGASAGS